jgi:hypothetical protein
MAETHTVGKVIQHDGDAPPSEAVHPPPAAAPEPREPEPEPPAPRRKGTRTSRPKATRAVKAAQTQRRKRLGKHRK